MRQCCYEKSNGIGCLSRCVVDGGNDMTEVSDRESLA